MKTSGFRALVGIVLVVGLVVGADAQPAAAFASTGTVTVEGSYYYSYSSYRTTSTYPTSPYNSYDWYDIDAYLDIYSTVCTDTWAGTTTPGSGGGATCALWLSGYYWQGQTSKSGAGLRFTGQYTQSGGAWNYPLELTGGGASWAVGPGTLTGNLSSYDGYAGPVTVNYSLTPTYSYSCFPFCYPGTSYSYYYGIVTLTIDYVVH